MSSRAKTSSGDEGHSPRFLLLDKVCGRCPPEVSLALDLHNDNAKVNFRHVDVDKNEGMPCGIVRDLAMMRMVSHPNIAKLIKVNMSGAADKAFVLCAGHTRALRTHLREQGAFRGLVLKRAVLECVRGLHALHRWRIAHRWLHGRSVTVDMATGAVVISDFFNCGDTHTREASIEELLGMEDSDTMALRADIWSLGTVVAEMVTGGVRLFPTRAHLFERLMDICGALGTPTEETMPGCSSLSYFSQELPQLEGVGLKATMLKAGGADAVNEMGKQGMGLLHSLFLHDPAARPDARSLLAHNFLYEAKTWPETLGVACRATAPRAPQSLQPRLSAAVQDYTGTDWRWSFPGHVHQLLQEYLGPAECLPALVAEARQFCRSARASSLSDAAALAQLHAVAQRHRLLAKSNYRRLMPSEFIVHAALWYAEAFPCFKLPDGLIYKTLMLLARVVGGDGNGTADQIQLLAAMLLAAKTESETPHKPHDYVQHILASQNVDFSLSDVVSAEFSALVELNGDLGCPTAFDFLSLLTQEVPRWLEMAAARQAAEVFLQATLADAELFFGSPHLSLASATLAMGLAVCEEAPTAAWAAVQAAAEVCGSSSGDLMRIAHRIHRLWKRGAARTQKLYSVIFSDVRGWGAARALDGLQLGWPWMRARLARGLLAG